MIEKSKRSWNECHTEKSSTQEAGAAGSMPLILQYKWKSKDTFKLLNENQKYILHIQANSWIDNR